MMKKFFYFVIIAILCSPVIAWGQVFGDNPTTTEERTPTQAEVFQTKADNFADTKLKNVAGVDAGDYKEAVAELMKDAPKDWETGVPIAFDGKYDATKYWTMVENNWTQMFGKFTNSTLYPKDNSSLRKEYANEFTKLTQGFLQDMVKGEGADLLELADNATDLVNLYKSDYDQLYETYMQNLKLLNAKEETAQGEKQWFSPYDFLDKAASEQGNKQKWGARLELLYAGANDKYLYASMLDLIYRIKNTYSGRGYQQLEKDLDWFLKVWGQASELGVVPGSGISGNSKMTTVNKSYVVNEYGVPTQETDANPINGGTSSTQTANNDEYAGITQESTYSLRDESYNNRSYGYRNGNFKTIRITVENRRYQLYDHLYTSPIVLDMDGDEKLEASNGEWLPHSYKNTRLAEFDMNGDGFIDLTEWVGQNDGLLLVYKKGEEVNANNLFGEAGGFSDGFEKLSIYDVNNDKQLTGDELKTFSVWQDKNLNAKVDDGEALSVAELNITNIALNHKGLVSSFVQNGKTKKLWDWYPCIFPVKKMK